MATPDPALKSSSEIFRVFISYAREDEKIASAVREAISAALGPFAEVFKDDALRFGLSFEDEIKAKLEETHLLVVVYSATLKPVFSFAGMELGFFMGLMKRDPDSHRIRRIVPIYLEAPPEVIAGKEGINIGISRSTLAMSDKEYSENLQSQVNSEHEMVRFLGEFQGIVDDTLKDNRLTVSRRPEEKDLCGIVRKMQLSIFSHLKTTPESTLKPQKQITVRTYDFGPGTAHLSLPLDARLIPVGTGNPMSIFGLPNQETSWKEFCAFAKNSKFGDTWVDAIKSVLSSSLQGQIEVDNSQVIVSNDATHAFRVILTTGTRYFNGIREFNLYFVEYLNRREFGDKDTSLILKGLELACRFRFLFLEKASEFSHMSIRIASSGVFHEIVRNLERELNLFRRDTLEAGLDRPGLFAEFIEWQTLQKMSEQWRPLEFKLRECCVQIREAPEGSDKLPGLRDALVSAVEQLETAMRPLNSEMICRLADNLKARCSCS